MIRTFFIETIGCQMNVLDSELIRAGLLASGFLPADDLRRADILLFNTCSVRQRAEDKIYSALGRLKHLKQHRPHAVIGVVGCMAQKEQKRIFQRAPHVDLIVGPGQIGRVAALVETLVAERSSPEARDAPEPRIEVSLDRGGLRRRDVEASFESFDPGRAADARHTPYQAMVRAMFGCDKFCSYCIVPSVRGPEQSRPVAEIEAELRQLADQGCVEATLIGQTVNSYLDRSTGRSLRLADLLARVHDIGGIRRLKFVTNYPRHMTEDLLAAVCDLPKVSPYLHVPAQSGSDRMLRRMKRSYSSSDYREMLERIRAILPEAAVTSDFIVGFCGETDADFEATVELVRIGRFKNSFIFKYSTREGTRAAELYEDDVPYPVKQRRNNELLAVQNEISEELNLPFVGREVEILVEGPSKAAAKRGEPGQVMQLTGRTVCDRIVVFDGPVELAGRILPVAITAASPMTLYGRLPGPAPQGPEQGARSPLAKSG